MCFLYQVTGVTKHVFFFTNSTFIYIKVARIIFVLPSAFSFRSWINGAFKRADRLRILILVPGMYQVAHLRTTVAVLTGRIMPIIRM